MKTRFYNSPGVGIYTPSEIEIFGYNENSAEILIGAMKLNDIVESNILNVEVPL
ncbi:MAG: hypothetical protein R2771_08625 [Saprospiraceae bacterium]